MASLLERTVYLDKSIGIYVGELIEYDMREGGWSIIQRDHLLPDSIIDEFSKLTKDARHKAIGNLAHSHNRAYKHVPKLLIDKFREYRLLFGERNNLTDDDLFYIRKDAICVKKYCYETKMDEYIDFREKRVWNCYMRIEPQWKEEKQFKPEPIEFYWSANSGRVTDVKGISDDVLPPHEQGILKVVSKFMRYLYSLDYDGALKYIIEVMDAYKKGLGDGQDADHPEYLYRRFDGGGKYKILQDGVIMEVEEIAPSLISRCDKAYNYRNIFVPMMNLVIR